MPIVSICLTRLSFCQQLWKATWSTGSRAKPRLETITVTAPTWTSSSGATGTGIHTLAGDTPIHGAELALTLTLVGYWLDFIDPCATLLLSNEIVTRWLCNASLTTLTKPKRTLTSEPLHLRSLASTPARRLLFLWGCWELFLGCEHRNWGIEKMRTSLLACQ